MASIQRKSDALKRYNNGANENINFFCEDINKDNAKRFYVINPKVIFEKMNDDTVTESHFYESWSDASPMVFALDLDMKGVGKNLAKNIMQSNIDKVIKAASKYYNYDYEVKNIIVLESDPIISQKESKKYSYHVIFRGLRFQTHEVCKDFFDQANKDYDLQHCDNSIYNLTCLRLCYNCKMGKKAILLPYEAIVNDQTTMTQINTSFTAYQYFLRTMLTHILPMETKTPMIKKAKMFIKPKPEPEEYLNKDKNSVDNLNFEELLDKLPCHCSDDYDTWIKTGLVLHGCGENLQSKVKMLELWDKWSQNSDKYNASEVRQRWNGFERSRPISIGWLINLCKREGITNIYKNNKQTFEQVIKEFPERPILLDTNMKTLTIDQEKLTPALFEPYLNKRLIAIQSEKGTGKTSNLLRALFENGHVPDSASMLFVSSRRTFGAKLLGDLEEYKFVLYSNIKSSDIHNHRVICQVDSLSRLAIDKFDYVIVDECESTARYITGKHFTKNAKASVIVSTMEQRIAEAKQVVILDADLSNRCTEYYKTLTNIDEFDDENYQLIINKHKAFCDYTMLALNYDDWVQKVMEDVKANKKLVIPMASNNKSKDLKTKIELDFPNKNILLIHKETKDEDKIAGLMKVNETWITYDVVIYTPSVCMGVSFDVPGYFDHIYCYGCEKSLGAQEFAQMIHRVRSPKSKKIYCALNIYRPFDEIEDIISFKQTEEVLCSDYYLSNHDLHQNLVKTKMTRDEKSGDKILLYPYKDDADYRLFVHNALESILNDLNFGASFFGYIKTKGYKIDFFKYDIENKDFRVKAAMKSIGDQRKSGETELEVQAILDAPDISKDEFHDLVKCRDEFLEENDVQKINRYKLRDCYGVYDFELTYDFVEEFNCRDKMKWYHNLTNIMSTDDQNTEEKLNIMKNNVSKDKWLNTCYMDFTNKSTYVHQLYATNIIQNCGLDLNNMECLITQTHLEENIKNAISYVESNKKEMAYKFSNKLYNKKILDLGFKEMIKVINGIITGFYGIKIKRVSPYKKNILTDDIWYKLCDNKLWDTMPRDDTIVPINLKVNDGDMFKPLATEHIINYMIDDDYDESKNILEEDE